jgi:HPt (histidine-containing phosphotransfer) domain-containing protein
MTSLEATLMSRLLPGYERARADDRVRLHSALADSDFHILERLGHKIRGSAATYGFEKTAQLAERLERAAINRRIADCIDLVSEMEGLLFKA